MSKKLWQKKERQDAKDFGARQMPRSGGFWSLKGDSQSDKFLIESKTSKHNRFSVTEKMWNKADREALLSNRMPIISVKFGDENIELVILEKNDFMTLIVDT